MQIEAVISRTPVASAISVGETVGVGVSGSAKCWSEWQDLNLRPPRPERGSGPAEFASAFASELLSTGQDQTVRHN